MAGRMPESGSENIASSSAKQCAHIAKGIRRFLTMPDAKCEDQPRARKPLVRVKTLSRANPLAKRVGSRLVCRPV